jgi:hypothetical protein
MKLITTALVALLASASIAAATDLPSKKKAPAAPAAAPAAAVVAAATSSDSLSVTYGQDLGTNFGAKVDDAYGVTYKHTLPGGVFVGGAASTTQVPGSQLNQNLEAQAGLALPSMAGVSLSAKGGIGEKFSTTNFPYYAVYGNADYDLGNGFTINAVSYRYRNAFDTTNSYQSHQVGTGVTYALNSTYSVSGKVYRNLDSGFNATGDAFAIGLNVKF